MGQATVSPDPLDESTTTTTSIASADDLLAQLAGEEIDRLLAESEAERASAGAERTADAPEPAAAPTSAPERSDPRIEQFIPTDVATTNEAPHAMSAPRVPTPPQPAAAMPAAMPAVGGDVPAPAGNIDVASDATAAAERAALCEAAPGEPAVAHVEPEQLVDEPQPLPLLLRPLEWLNVPLASCPEALRETLGKVAIVTLVNAIAVLAYVLMFRTQ